ncbi:MAG TPA: hypothetical protein VFD58_19555 [Blastocatellia bacterium]|nr:hypothetical protein [Blastocatellia bacterium]
MAPKKTDTGRRKLLIAGAGGLGVLGLAAAGLNVFKSPPARTATVPTPVPPPSTPVPVPSAAVNLPPLKPVTLSAGRANAVRAADEIIEHYARVLQNPSAVIHAVRGFGRDFKLADGSNAVDWLCAHFAAEKTVNGQKYVYFPRPAEVHDNSFLKTFLEAGVSPDQPIIAGGNRYTLKQLGEHAKLTFRCNPNNFAQYDKDLYHEHLPWCLIAFSTLTPPAQPTWANAYGEVINLAEVIDKGVASYEADCAGVREAIASNQSEPERFREVMRKHSCFGMHAIYGFFASLNNGYRNNNLNERLNQLLDVTTHRLRGDSAALDQEFAEAGQKSEADPRTVAQLQTIGLTVPGLTEAFRLRAQIKLIGHAFEAINFTRLHKLFTLTPEQNRRMLEAEQKLYEYIVKLRATDLEPLRKFQNDSKFVSDIVISLGHAARAMKLLTPDNPDTVAMNVKRK